MFRSFRFRLPAVFLAGIIVAGLVSSAIALGLFDSYAERTARRQAFAELKREARGVTQLYAREAGRELLPGAKLELATGDRIYYIPVARGIEIFPGEKAFTHLSRYAIPGFRAVLTGHTREFEFVPPGEHRRFLAVARPVKLGRQTFGAFIVAKPKTVLHQDWARLLERLALAFLGGLLVAGALAWYLSRRITAPVLALSRAADQVAEGRYDVAVPDVPGGGEIDQLVDRFREMAARLAEAEELERHFLMTVSHELRTPLTAIRGHVEALREGVAKDKAARAESLSVIAEETNRLERLVGDVLDLAKLDAHRFTVLEEEVDMERLVDRAYAAFGEEARRRGIDYRRTVGARPVIVSDGDRVLQIISNLLANAFRWTPNGGRVELALGADDGYVSVAVGDSGPGIGAEERERIFRPFWSQDGGGTGLGLAIARELALALGGKLEVDSSPGRGSRFELVLPASGD